MFKVISVKANYQLGYSNLLLPCQ